MQLLRRRLQIKNLVEDTNLNTDVLSPKDSTLELPGHQRTQFAKRFQACKSVDEVLFFAFIGERRGPAELASCLRALVKTQYKTVSSFPWAYYDSDIMLWIQSNINSESEDLFRSLHRHPSFADLLREVQEKAEKFTPDEVVDVLYCLLKLCMNKENDVLVKLQEMTLQKYKELNLRSLGKLSTVSNFLKRNGFVVSCAVCSVFQDYLDEIPISADSYRNLALIASNVSYFMSPQFLDSVLEKAVAILGPAQTAVSFSDTLLLLEAAAKFSSKNPDYTGPLIGHVVQNIADLSVHQLSKLVRLTHFAKIGDPQLEDAVRTQAQIKLDYGLLRASDIVSLISIFDVVGWTNSHREEFSNYLSVHMFDMDTLLIKHLAKSSFISHCRDKKLMTMFAKRWSQKLEDISDTVSVLMVLVALYNRTQVIPRPAQDTLQVRCAF